MKKLLKVLILGVEKVGKTSLTNQFVNSKFTEAHTPTIGADFLVKEVQMRDGTVITLQIWDTAGQERFQSLGVAFYRGSDACILLFDITQSDTFEAIEGLREEFIQQAGIRDPEKYPFIVVGNKTDMDNRQVSSEKAQEWCRSKGKVTYIETSCKDRTNIDKVFESIPEILFTPEQTWWSKANVLSGH